MRTTLTLDEDVAQRLLHLQRETGVSFKDVVNRALRLGTQQMQMPAPQGAAYRTRSVSLGRCKLGDVVSVTQAMAAAEGEDFR